MIHAARFHFLLILNCFLIQHVMNLLWQIEDIFYNGFHIDIDARLIVDYLHLFECRLTHTFIVDSYYAYAFGDD